MVTLESKVSLSESMIWPTQKAYYQSMGIEAWSESVPFYITSNVFIAKQYASLIANFIADYLDDNPQARSHPFPILELGAGTGQFTYYLTQALKEQLKQKRLEDISINYIVTDIAKSNLNFIAKHKALASSVEDGLLYFAYFDVEKDSQPTLITTLPNNNCSLDFKNPLITVANYLFDSLSCDVFFLKNKQLHESLVTLKTTKKNTTNGQPVDWEEVKLSFDNTPISDNHYNDKQMNAVLSSHQDAALDNTHFIFPTGSINALRNLKHLAKGKLLVICSDKAFTSLEEMSEQDAPTLDVHGSFSMMVNLFALTQWNKQNGGKDYIPSARDGLTTALLITESINTDRYDNFNRSLYTNLEEFSPTDYFNLYEQASANTESWALAEILSLLTLSGWDSGLYEIFADRLSELLATDESQLVDRMVNNLSKIAKNYYFTPGSDDVFFRLATQYYELDYYEEALELYEMSNHYFPHEYVTHFNQGLCHYYLENHSKAILLLNQALAIEPGNKDCVKQLQKIKAAQTKQKREKAL